MFDAVSSAYQEISNGKLPILTSFNSLNTAVCHGNLPLFVFDEKPAVVKLVGLIQPRSFLVFYEQSKLVGGVFDFNFFSLSLLYHNVLARVSLRHGCLLS
jgi:hypothetical protein